MDSANIIEIAIAYYKDKTQQELLEKFQVESRHLIQADADARRTIAREDIITMEKLKLELQKFEFAYNRISSSCGKIEEIEAYISGIKTRLKWLSYKKNNSR